MPIYETEQGWILETRATGYALGLNNAGLLAHCYWGTRLATPNAYPGVPSPTGWSSFDPAAHMTPEEYPGYAALRYGEPCLKVSFIDGVRDVDLRFDSAEVRDGPTAELRVYLRDAVYPFRVTLDYRVHTTYDLIERSVTVANDGDLPITIERIWSAEWHAPSGDSYRLAHLTGRWGDEMHLHREKLIHGSSVIESRRLTTSHQHLPWFALDRGNVGEETGEVWFGTLAWSGNWKICAELTEFDAIRVGIGVNDWDFAWRLDPGTMLTTPSSYAGYTSEGFGGASRRLHDFIRDTLLPHQQTIHKVLYNSWEATVFDVHETSQVQLAEIAAEMGIELFVVDDGWFHGRSDDTAGLGDWWPDERKFPHGMMPLIKRVNALGMEFGLWIEPEMVSPNSDLYHMHPDWVLHFPTRPRTTARNQLILNLARDDVQDYVIDLIDRLLTRHVIAFIKWDMNRAVSEPGWPTAPGDPREVWVRYVQGLYRVWTTLRERHPHVIWQSCAGGGGRADMGILRLADQIWISDNTDPVRRLSMHEGFSQIFPSNTMESWVTDAGSDEVSLAFRFHVSMCGTLGVGAHLLHWTAKERTEAKHWIALYKEIRAIVQLGDQYRLWSPQAQPCAAVLYISKDRSEAVLFAFRMDLPPPTPLPPLRLRGLDPEGLYAVEGIAKPRSGMAWMHEGMHLELENFESTVRRIRRVEVP